MANSKISALTSATTPLAGTETLPVVQSSTTKQVSVANLTAGRQVDMSLLNVSNTAALLGNFNSTNATGGYLRWQTSGTTIWDIGTAKQVFNTGTGTDGGFGTRAGYYLGLGANGAETIRLTTDNNVTVVTAAKGINFTANTPAAGMTSQLLNWYEEGTWTPSLLYQDPTGLTITYANQNGYYTRVGRQVTAHAYIKVTLVGTPVTDNVNVNGFPFTSLNSTNSYATGNIIVGSAASGSSATQKFSLLMGPNVTYALITDCKGSGNQGSAIGVGVNVVITATISYFV